MKAGVQEDSDGAETGREFAMSSTWDKHSTAWTLAGKPLLPLPLEDKSPREASVYLHRALGAWDRSVGGEEKDAGDRQMYHLKGARCSAS